MTAALLHELVSEQAERRPDATAIVMGSERLSYAALEARSSRLARALAEAGCRHGDRVVLFLPKSPWAISAMIAASKAGCLYVPVDITSPATRVARIASSCEPSVVLASSPSAKLLAEVRAVGALGSARVGFLERTRCAELATAPVIARSRTFDLDDIECCPLAPMAQSGAPPQAAHIFFTSGSTGQPKGVVVDHQSVLAFVRWATAYLRMGSHDRVSGHSPLHFDLSTFDIYGAFAVGAELHLVPPEHNLLPNQLAQFIRNSALTQWFSVPSALTYMAKFDVVERGHFPALDRLLWCGDVLPTPVLAHLMQRLPHVAFTNLYGPTETTIASSYYGVPACPVDERSSIPIGRPCHGEELLVLDDALQHVPPGEVGHLYIGGVGLSPGYWRDAELTRAAFVTRKEGRRTERIYRTGDLARRGTDGLVYFLGRADTQIKSRGYRIELAEVECAANTLPELHEGAVVAIDRGGFEGATICLAYAVTPGTKIELVRIREALVRLLPNYMLPSRWMELQALPKNPNGKIDRTRVKELFERALDVPALSAAERTHE